MFWCFGVQVFRVSGVLGCLGFRVQVLGLGVLGLGRKWFWMKVSLDEFFLQFG